MGLSDERIFRCITRRMSSYIAIYKFCICSNYARIRFGTFSYSEAARGVLSAQNFPTYESVGLARFAYGVHTCEVFMAVNIRPHTLRKVQIMHCASKTYV